jgi:hypothetical protein
MKKKVQNKLKPDRPHRRGAHENPDVPHDAPGPEEEKAPGTEISFSVRSDPHEGHGGAPSALTGTSSSNFSPQSRHLYS